MPGPRRKPAELELKQGNPGKRSRKALEAAAAATSDIPVAPTADVPPPPIALTDAGLAIWATLYHYLARRNQIKEGDAYSLARLCDLYASRETLMAACRNRRGRFAPTYQTLTTSGGKKIVMRPEWTMANALLPQILALEREFGLTPSSRAAVVGKLADSRDPDRPSAAPSSRPASQTGTPDSPPAPPLAVGKLSAPRTMN